ncbi:MULTISPECIES: nitroreductase/quinone reductase family protein [unclassified Streptomyces]|uniref:nitroreductase/quinone reductase family protein n=1 Tax=unclassified Streptomyces TaxID=2593676 RepID=UPI001BED3BFD|nr:MULTISPECIES: nitroreductase/quinone reductase family protein [unclassified Streptomyces]MBT2408532.1 nitroreductase family deazaflavin-dependent oxidoreductase [Streptomyces sp. ISL-21]MBT2612251.1 nitroreductase family deazaflavin-dependent oxidoreductase [Streptomyces sp. ISL-87]
MNAPTPYYVQAGPFAVRFNALFGKLARLGISLAGTAELSVRGRKSGEMQRIPVNPHTHQGEQYLVSARGHSQWVRNMRVAGGGELRLGRKVRTFTVTEINDPVQQAAVLRTYLEKWGWEVNRFFQGVTAQSSEAELQAAAADHPVFRITVAN